MASIRIEDNGNSLRLTTVLPSGRDASVDVYLPSPYDLTSFERGWRSRKPEPEVNWSALGSVTVEDAQAYAELIKAAAVKAAARRTS